MRWRSFLNIELVAGSVLLLVFAAVALAAPLLAPPGEGDPYAIPGLGIAIPPAEPSPNHPLGLMAGQHDILYGIVWGTRVAFKVGLLVTAARALFGVLMGLLAGYLGGLFDAALMRVTDAFMAFPIFIAVMVMSTLLQFGPFRGRQGGVQTIIALALILFGWMQYARLVRGNVLAERSKEYVQAAIAVGVRARSIIFRHVLPNCVAKGLFVLMASDVGAMVVLMSMFSFIGVGGGARPVADWGQMLGLSRDWIIGAPGTGFQYWYTFIPASMAILIFAVAWNLVGDGLDALLDPRLRRSR
ncbi:MAG: ABC transporter permease [Chloroflexi bacterium]|nr:ABC transporter permease [Chloroflexota bacterium]